MMRGEGGREERDVKGLVSVVGRMRVSPKPEPKRVR